MSSQWALNEDGSMSWPPCANKRDGGPCASCAYCKRRVLGPEWWLVVAKMRAAKKT